MNTKLLYVEDELEYAGLIGKLLANEGFETAFAPTAAKADKLFREFRPELVMVDLDLQYEKEGLEIIRSIHRQSPWFPVIVYSSHADPQTVIETMEYGVLHHVSKDRSIPELVAMLRNALHQTYRCKEHQNPEYRLSATTTYYLNTKTLVTDGKTIPLNRMTGTLLQQLCLHINEFVPPEELFVAIWGFRKEMSELRRYITKLRKIIEQDPDLRLLNQSGGYYQLECNLWKQETKE